MSILNLEWFGSYDFALAYKRAKQDKKMLVAKRNKQIMADFADKKDKISNPLIEVKSEEGLLIVSRIVNFERELRQVDQDIPVNLVYEGSVIARLRNIRTLFEE